MIDTISEPKGIGDKAAIAPDTAGQPVGAPVVSPPRPERPRPFLTADEELEFSLCKRIIERTFESFVECGLAFGTIIAKRLYRATHETFDAWCQEFCGGSTRQIYRIVASAQMVQGWRESAPGLRFPIPAGEKTTRPLLSLPADQQMPAWLEAVSLHPNGRPSYKDVLKVVQARRGIPLEPAPAAESGNGGTGAMMGSGSIAPDPEPAPSRSMAPLISRGDKLRAQTDRTIINLRELLDLAGTADSQKAAGLGVALEQLQDYRDHLAKMEEMHARRQ